MGIAELLASLQAVIFDVDGTLVSSNDAHAHAWHRALAEHDVHVPYETIRRRMGMGIGKLLPMVAALSAESELGRRIDKRRQHIFMCDLLPDLRATPGSADLFRSLHRHRVVCAIASASQHEELSALLEVAGVKDLASVVVSGSDVNASKPAPTVVCTAIAKLGFEPTLVAMVGDSPYDVEAAMHAGLPLIALRTGGYSDEVLEGAIVIYDDPRALRRAFDGAFSRGRQIASAR